MMIKYFVSFTIFVFFASNFLKAEEQDCAFCNQQVVDNQKFYEESLVMALYSYKPIFPGHVLIIPKRHVERYESLTDEEILQMGQVVKKVHRAVMKVFATSAYLLLQKNGKEVGQTVPHVHIHYIPRKAGENSTLKFMSKMLIRPLFGPISADEMHANVEKLKQAMQNLGEE